MFSSVHFFFLKNVYPVTCATAAINGHSPTSFTFSLLNLLRKKKTKCHSTEKPKSSLGISPENFPKAENFLSVSKWSYLQILTYTLNTYLHMESLPIKNMFSFNPCIATLILCDVWCPGFNGIDEQCN